MFAYLRVLEIHKQGEGLLAESQRELCPGGKCVRGSNPRAGQGPERLGARLAVFITTQSCRAMLIPSEGGPCDLITLH
jgi:hypothetical protein